MRKFAIIAASLLAALPLAVQAGSLSGTIYDASGIPAADVQVSIAELGLQVQTAADGSYRFAGLADGQHFIVARAPGASAQRVAVTLVDGGDAQRNMFLMSRSAVREVAGPVMTSASTAQVMAETQALADRMLREGTSQGDITRRWRDLDG